jgi:hypothetical protein
MSKVCVDVRSCIKLAISSYYEPFVFRLSFAHSYPTFVGMPNHYRSLIQSFPNCTSSEFKHVHNVIEGSEIVLQGSKHILVMMEFLSEFGSQAAVAAAGMVEKRN